jgi:outer membrane protein assembly factor BamB/tRNA A-37 threonylcarbamoyl transferase component Bud32
MESSPKKSKKSKPKPSGNLQKGQLLQDRYEVQEVVGRGGMGAVYRARDKNFKAIRLVAVKEMITRVTDDLIRKNIYKIFEREANILATLRHPSIPRIYDYFIENDRAYLVLEFVNGKNLEQIVSEADDFFTEQQVLGWGVEICDVLDYLHSYQPEAIVFRDIKPSNIMINLQGHVALVDFGIAKVFEGDQKNTMVGTQGYSPPDQYRGEATPKVDIYAMGATLHHLLTLKDPQLEAPFSFGERPINETNANVSPELIAVVDRALAYKPEDRYESTAEMKDALINVAQQTGTLINLTTPSSAKSSSVKPIWSLDTEDEVRGTPILHEGTLYVGSYDKHLYAVEAGSGKVLWKYASDGGITGKAAVSENKIYFGSEDRRLHVVSARTGKVVWTYFSDGPVRSSPRIAQGHAFVGSDDGYLHAVNTVSGRLSWKAETGSPVRSTPFVTDEYAFFGSEDGDFTCVDFRGDARWRFKAKRAITSSPIVVNDAVLFASMDSTLYSLEAKSGWAIWRFRLGKGSISSPVVADGKIYIGAADNVIYCIDMRSAKENWRFETQHQIASSPIVHNGAVYCGSVDGKMYCLDAEKGTLRWSFETNGPITGSALIHEDIVFFGSSDKKIYALPA